MPAPKHSIFISYRRRDSIYAVDRLDERLKRAFGAAAVFRDVRSIRKGLSFPDDLRAALGEAAVGIVVIGPWGLDVALPTKPKRPPRRGKRRRRCEIARKRIAAPPSRRPGFRSGNPPPGSP